MLNKRKIYALIDPRTKSVMYVGKTKNTLLRRLYCHVRIAKRGRPKTKKRDWILSLVSLGLKPEIKLLEICDKYNWRDRELFWCSQFNNLLNANKAGGGGDGERLNRLSLEAIINELGVISDSRIAEKIGVNRKTISYYREQMGISAADDNSRKKPPPQMGGHNKKNIDESLLGKMPDYILAEKFGVEKSCIARRRRKHKILSYAEQTGNDGKIKIGEPHRRWK